MGEGPVNLNWGPIMKTINESPHDFFAQGGWSFLGGAGDESEHSEGSPSESEFEADSEDLVEESSSAEESAFEASDASGSDGSASDFGDGSDSEGQCASG